MFKIPVRFYILILLCFLSFGSYYAFDNPAALQTILEDDSSLCNNPSFCHLNEQGKLVLTSLSYNLLYSLYSWPNVILCFFGGILVDTIWGVRKGGIIFAVTVTIGSALVALGSQIKSYELMLAGRFVFGLGGECLVVAQNTYGLKHFKGKELNTVFGLMLSFSRVGSTLNLNIEKPIAKATSLEFSLWVSVGMCGMSVLSAVLLAIIDYRVEKESADLEDCDSEENQTKDFHADVDAVKLPWYVRAYNQLDFGVPAWLVFVICVFAYIAVFPFVAVATDFFTVRWPQWESLAGTIDGLPYIISGAACPFLGFAVDKSGYNPVWVAIAILGIMGGHCMMAFSDAELIPWAAMVVIGIAYSLLACGLWPMVGYLVEESKVGTAYGLMQSVQNTGLAVVPLLVGSVVQSDPSYTNAMWLFIGFAGAGFLFTLLLILVDVFRSGRILMRRQPVMLVTDDVDAEWQAKEPILKLVPRNEQSTRMHYLGHLGIFPDHHQIPHAYRPSR